MAFVHRAQRPVDLHAHVGILRRGERGMRKQPWFITALRGCHNPSAPEHGARDPTICYWTLQRHTAILAMHMRISRRFVIPELADHTQEIEL